MVVVTIIALLGVLAAPSLSTVFQGSQINQAGQLIQDQLSMYRQYAVANNCTVDVRFYRFHDANMPGDPANGYYRAIQALKVNASSPKTPITKAIRLPAGVIIDSGSTLTSLFNNTPANLDQSPASTDPTLFNLGNAYLFADFQFKPDGSTNLSSSSVTCWYLTVHQLQNGDQLTAAPSNYYTVQLDPTYGHIASFRP